MPRPGRALETLVAHLEKTLIACDDVTVESPGFVADLVTQELREFDVLVTIRKAHHTLRTVFEVKDLKTKVGSPQIEQFATKTFDTGIEDKYFVSANGYSRPAIKKAQRYNIKCLSLEEVLRLQWCVAGGMTIVTRRRLVPHLNFVAVDEAACFAEAKELRLSTHVDSEKPWPMSIVLPAGTKVDWKTIADAAWASVADHANALDESRSSGTATKTVELLVKEEAPLYLVWNGSTVRHLLKSIQVTLPYEIVTQVLPFSLRSYHTTDGAPLAEVALTPEVDVRGGKVAFSFVKDATNGQVSFHMHSRPTSRDSDNPTK